MSLLDFGADEANAAAPNYIPPPKPKTSAWADVGSTFTAVPRGIGEAAAQVMGTAADLANAARAFRDTPSRDMKARGLSVESYSSDLGDALRDRGREFRPDPETASTAEQVLYGFARGAAKIVGGAVAGGPAGVLAAGAEEAFTQADELKRQGVDVDTRGKAGLVQGAGLALAALPAAGTTIKSTLALYAAGGPGGFVAQQALTREILQSAGYDKIGAGFDPLDPVGLAVSALIPAGFAAYGFRQAKIAAAVRDLPDLPKATQDAPAAPAAVPDFALSPVAKAVKQYPQEVEDAARVLYQADMRESANPGAGMEAANKHADALARAEDQMARGEPVQVADVAPAPASRFRAVRSFDEDYPTIEAIEAGFDRGELLVHARVKDGTDFEYGIDPSIGDFIKSTESYQSMIEAHGDAPELTFFSDKDLPIDSWAKYFAKDGKDVEIVVVRKGDGMQKSLGNGRVLDPSGKESSYEMSPLADYENPLMASEPAFVERGDWYTNKSQDVVAVLDYSPMSAWADQLQTATREAQKADPAPLAEPSTPVANAQQLDAFFAQTKPAATEPGAAFDAAAPARLDEIRLQYPDLMVQMDGGAPMRMDDFLAAAKAEADELAADAPLMVKAAECALTFGL
jgi:hypothetical protein